MYLCSIFALSKDYKQTLKKYVTIKKKITMTTKYYCTVCDWVYDPAVGDPDSGIAPGTKFEDIPDDWACPVCGVTKDMFEIVEE